MRDVEATGGKSQSTTNCKLQGASRGRGKVGGPRSGRGDGRGGTHRTDQQVIFPSQRRTRSSGVRIKEIPETTQSRAPKVLIDTLFLNPVPKPMEIEEAPNSTSPNLDIGNPDTANPNSSVLDPDRWSILELVEDEKEVVLEHLNLQILSAYVDAYNAEIDEKERRKEGRIKIAVNRANLEFINMLWRSGRSGWRSTDRKELRERA
ncbi:hypothetical protein AgCh_018054 [Apium graveolens]